MNRLALTVSLVVALIGARRATAAVDFAEQIRPIFAETCYKCHGHDKDKGDLRLHSKADIMATDTVVIPGKPEESELFKRITLPADHDDVMPPEGKADPLTKEQQELIKQWIAEGAQFGDWTEDTAPATSADAAILPGRPQPDVLPEVAPAPQEAIARLQEAGALAMPLAQNTNLLNIDFRAEAANTTDAQLALLAPVKEQVAWLGLAGTKVTDAGLEQIKDLTNLRRLHLERTEISDAGLDHLSEMANLRYLNLYGTKVTDAGLKKLLMLPNLEKLYLWQTQVSDSGALWFLETRAGLHINRGWTAPTAAPVEVKDPEPVAAAEPDPNSAEAKFAALADKFTAGSCCDNAHKEGKVCTHACCKKALEEGKVCSQCNP